MLYCDLSWVGCNLLWTIMVWMQSIMNYHGMDMIYHKLVWIWCDILWNIVDWMWLFSYISHIIVETNISTVFWSVHRVSGYHVDNANDYVPDINNIHIKIACSNLNKHHWIITQTKTICSKSPTHCLLLPLIMVIGKLLIVTSKYIAST